MHPGYGEERGKEKKKGEEDREREKDRKERLGTISISIPQREGMLRPLVVGLARYRTIISARPTIPDL